MKRLFAMMLTVALIFSCMNLTVLASEETYPPGFHNVTSTDDESTDTWNAILRGTYLSSGSSTITRASSSTINIGGTTSAYSTCDTVELRLYVERSTSYSTGYGNYKTYKYSADDVYKLSKEISNISITKGYYYRVKGVHSVTKGSTTETTNTVTNPIDFR